MRPASGATCTSSAESSWRPPVGFAPKLSDAELATLAVISALLGHESERGFVRPAARNEPARSLTHYDH